MRVNRSEFLKVLDSVSPGLSNKEIIEQSSCFVFEKGRVYTFNDEVSCQRDSPINIQGAIRADILKGLFHKLKEDELEVEVSGGTFEVRGKRKKTQIRLEEEVVLPIEYVEQPGEWVELPEDFPEAITVTSECYSRERSEFDLTCIHITGEYMEACDRFQAIRYPLDLDVGMEFLVRGDTLSRLVGFDVTHYSETDSWIHFQNDTGLIISCRRHEEEYRPIDDYFKTGGLVNISMPKGIEEVVDRAGLFSSENPLGDHVEVSLKNGVMRIAGEGAHGNHKEVKSLKGYDGDPVTFMISPKLLVEIGNKGNRCGVGEGRLSVSTGKYKFAVRTNRPEDFIFHPYEEGGDDDE